MKARVLRVILSIFLGVATAQNCRADAKKDDFAFNEKGIRKSKHCLLVTRKEGVIISAKVIRSTDPKEALGLQKKLENTKIPGLEDDGVQLLCIDDIVHDGKVIGIGSHAFTVEAGNVIIGEPPFRIKLSSLEENPK